MDRLVPESPEAPGEVDEGDHRALDALALAIEELRERVAALTPDQRGRVYEVCGEIEDRAKLVRQAIRDDARREPIPLDGGKELREVIAALYVQPDGCYVGIDGVDPWPEERDARLYAGPWPVVAHPPCARWGRYWSGGPIARVRRRLGDDDGCFAAAIEAVRRWGGVLEHPEASQAWKAHGLLAPPRHGRWVPAGDWRGWTCCVEQGHYGHAARKATWLYAVGTDLPPLIWGPSVAAYKLDEGYHSAEERRKYVRSGVVQRISSRERAATPIQFRDVLISIAASARAA